MNEDYFYTLFVAEAKNVGRDAAARLWKANGIGSEDLIDSFVSRYEENVVRIHEGGPAINSAKEQDAWYQGPAENDAIWNALVASLKAAGREDQIKSLDDASSKVVGETPDPSGPARSARGLVVGYVQSGKTTNFTAVAAKLADLGYRVVIVLSGIHNSLRRQTQERLKEQLIDPNPNRWFEATTLDDDFRSNSNAAAHLSAQGQTTLIVAKKNARVLERLLAWLKKPAAKQALADAKILVIDDEADQASVATDSINPLIRKILATMPRATYIGYTATPFANVFIDPADEEDLYPRDFILNLPRPENYFGPEKIFGRTDADPEGENVDGFDMIRLIAEDDEKLLRPFGKQTGAFQPTITDDVRDAVAWFLLATAARFHRGQDAHSSMLIHTSFKTQVHESFRVPLEELVAELKHGFETRDPRVMAELRSLWEEENKRVPAEEFGRTAETFEELCETLPRVFSLAKVVVDNSASEDRLIYPKDETAVVIGIGGNTLSRGLTLEGLVSSLFIRPSNTYDTLLQMGRWFGFRIGYEDLPRIWMTPTLRDAFHHLAMVEHEMRQDIDTYQLQNRTPMEVAVRIRTHPALRITAKMGAAAPARTSYSSTRLQTRFFNHKDRDWLQKNINAAELLISEAKRSRAPEKVDTGWVIRDVPAPLILSFLEDYQVRPESTDMEPALVSRYIHSRLDMDEPELKLWNVAVISGSGEEISFAGLDVKANVRSPLKDGSADGNTRPFADIKTLMSKEDMVVDLRGYDNHSKKRPSESALKAMRYEDEEYSKHGLLVLYPIDPNSSPSEARREFRTDLDAVEMPVGLALVFPHTADDINPTGSVRATHVAVELPEASESDDWGEQVFGDE